MSWRPRVSLKKLLLAVAILAVAFGATTWWWRQYRRVWVAHEQLSYAGAGADVYYVGELDKDFQFQDRDGWFYGFVESWEPHFLDRDMFFSIEAVFIGKNTERPLTNDDLALLSNFKKLKYVLIDCADEVDDRGLIHLQRLKQLRKLSLVRTSISDAGRERLERSLPDTEIEFVPATP